MGVVSKIESTYNNLQHSHYSWVIGVLLAIAAGFISNLGLNYQKLAHNVLQEKLKKTYIRDYTWISGTVLIFLGSVADFLALGFGAQSIIAPLGSVTLVSNVILAPIVLGEVFSKRDLFGTFLIVVGATVSVIFATHQNNTYSIMELFSFFSRPRFAIYVCIIVILVTFIWWYIIFLENLCFNNDPRYKLYIRYHRLCYASLSGILGAQSVLFAKCFAELIVNTFTGNGFLFAYLQTYLVIICMVGCIFLQIKWLNSGLQRFDAIYMVPVFQSFWIIGSVMGGLVFYGEYEEMSHFQFFFFTLGICLTVIGVIQLSARTVEDTLTLSQNVSHNIAHIIDGDEHEPLITNKQSNEESEDDSIISSTSKGQIEFDTSIGWLGSGAPATFSGSAMARLAGVFKRVASKNTSSSANDNSNSDNV